MTQWEIIEQLKIPPNLKQNKTKHEQLYVQGWAVLSFISVKKKEKKRKNNPTSTLSNLTAWEIIFHLSNSGSLWESISGLKGHVLEPGTL